MAQNPEELLNTPVNLDIAFRDLMRALCATLSADRCSLFLRNPDTLLSRMTHSWARKPEFELPPPPQSWKPQSPSLPDDDPMFAEALVNPEALYIEDVEMAGPDVLNAEFERKFYGHRALVHAPIYCDGKMYGILEPSVFGDPRIWSKSDRTMVKAVQRRLGVLVPKYVSENCR